MNNLFLQLGIESWKPFFTALLLPPLPFLFVVLVGAGLVEKRKFLGRSLVLVGTSLVWLSCCTVTGDVVTAALIPHHPALSLARIAELRSHAREPVAIIVLGSGVEDWAPEYSDSNLSPRSLDRLRYGIWLSRMTEWPLGFSGGGGWGQDVPERVTEAAVAARIASHEFNLPLRWVESRSRDTRENALNTVALLGASGIRHILLVTNGWHLPRALRNFEAAGNGKIEIDGAPMGLQRPPELPLLRWLPSSEGLSATRDVVREWLGRVAGA